MKPDKNFLEKWGKVDTPQLKPTKDEKPPESEKEKQIDNSRYAEEALITAEKMIRNAPDGEKHIELLKAAYLLGGYVEGGILEKNQARETLRAAIKLRENELEDIDHAYRTIDKGLANGAKEEITPKIIEDEREEYRKRNRKSKKIISPASDSKSFWKIETRGDNKAFIIPYTDFYDFLNDAGFGNYFYDEENFFLIEEKNNIVRKVQKIHLQHYVSAFISSLPSTIDEGLTPTDLKEVFFKKVDMLFSQNRLNLLNNLKPKFNRDTKHDAYFYFAKCIVRVNGEVPTVDAYENLSGHIWDSQIIDHDFELLTFDEVREKSEFYQFLFNISGENPQRLESLFSIIGYLLHDYKKASETKAVIFCDEKLTADPTAPNGRSGKGILVDGITRLKKTAKQDGKNFSFKKSFAFQNVDVDTRLLVFDDVPKRFPFERLFSVITEGMTIEKKFKDLFTLSFEDSPKVIITTNYMILGDGSSHEGRKIEFELSEHYNLSHTPVDDFGHLLFHDWDKDQWNLFYNTLIYCARYYLKKGLLMPPQINILHRKLILDTSSDFLEFMEAFDIVFGEEYVKKDLKSMFTDLCPDYSNKLTQNTFNKWLRKFADYKGYKHHERTSNSTQYIRFEKGENQ